MVSTPTPLVPLFQLRTMLETGGFPPLGTSMTEVLSKPV